MVKLFMKIVIISKAKGREVMNAPRGPFENFISRLCQMQCCFAADRYQLTSLHHFDFESLPSTTDQSQATKTQQHHRHRLRNKLELEVV